MRVGWRQSAIAGDQYVVRTPPPSRPHLLPPHRAKIPRFETAKIGRLGESEMLGACAMLPFISELSLLFHY